MTGERPRLRLIRSTDVEPERGWRHWLWLAREAAGTVHWRVRVTVAAMVAIVAPRVRA